MKQIIVFITVPNRKTAQKVKKALLDTKIAACISIVDKIDSFYWWKGKIEHSKELLLIIKTIKSNFPRLEREVKAVHPYETPEITAVDISGSKDYLTWIKASVNAC